MCVVKKITVAYDYSVTWHDETYSLSWQATPRKAWCPAVPRIFIITHVYTKKDKIFGTFKAAKVFPLC